MPVHEFNVQRYSTIRLFVTSATTNPLVHSTKTTRHEVSASFLSLFATVRRPAASLATSLERAPSCCRRCQIQRVHAVALCVWGAAMLCFDRLPSLRVANVHTNVPSFFDEEGKEAAFGTTTTAATITPIIAIDQQRRTSSSRRVQ